MGVYNRGGRWMVYFWEDGKRHDRSFGRGEEAQAAAVEFDSSFKLTKQLSKSTIDNAQSIQNINVIQASTASVSPENGANKLKLLDLANHFIEHLKASGRSESHIRSIELHVKKQFLPVLGNKMVDYMSYPIDILPFIRHFQEKSDKTGRKRSLATINMYSDGYHLTPPPLAGVD